MSQSALHISLLIGSARHITLRSRRSYCTLWSSNNLVKKIKIALNLVLNILLVTLGIVYLNCLIIKLSSVVKGWMRRRGFKSAIYKTCILRRAWALKPLILLEAIDLPSLISHLMMVSYRIYWRLSPLRAVVFLASLLLFIVLYLSKTLALTLELSIAVCCDIMFL